MDHESNAASKLSYDELIRIELQGKFHAVERYDSMVWKIRSGYVVILYGTLTIIGGANGIIGAPDQDNNHMLVAAFLLICGFSICGFVVDFVYLRSKFRVVNDTNKLQVLALKLATGKSSIESEYDELLELLHVSGEGTKKVPRKQYRQAWHPVVLIYLVTPLLSIAIAYILWSH